MKNYAMKKLLERQMKDVPEEQKQMIMEMVENNPELFEKIAKEMQAEMNQNGNNQMAAAQKILPKYQMEIAQSLSPETREKMAKMQMGAQGQFNPDGSLRK